MLFWKRDRENGPTAQDAERDREELRAVAAADDGELIRRRYRFVGQVQGVGFRWNSKKIADGMGLTGWVRNEDDGSVTCVLQGTQTQLATFATALRQDLSSWARYTIDDRWDEDVVAGEKDFRVRY